MPAVYAFAIILCLFAIGEIIATKTKAMVSTVFVVIVLLMIGFWLGLPANIIGYAQISGIALIMASATIISVGSSFNFKTLLVQWKTVIIALGSALAGVLLIWFVGQLFLGRYTAFAAGSIFAGTQAAIMMFTEAFTEHGMLDLIPFLILVFATDNLVGIPVCSYVLRREARRFIADPAAVEQYAQSSAEQTQASRKLLRIPEFLNKPSGIFLRIVLVSALSWWVSDLTGGRLHFLVASLILGVIFGELGFLPNDALNRTQSYLIVTFIITVFIFGALSDTTPRMILNMIGPLLFTLGAGFAGVLIAAVILGKLLHVSPWLAIGMGVSCSFGMPTTFIIPKEVAAEFGRTPQESQAIENYMIPNMVTAGFVSVTIASVFIAQFALLYLFG